MSSPHHSIFVKDEGPTKEYGAKGPAGKSMADEDAVAPSETQILEVRSLIFSSRRAIGGINPDNHFSR
jgi:hypothetical protein